jgi:hypothetical protein
LPFVSVWIRRIHDTNKSAWFFLLPVYNIFLLFVRGTKGDNSYGVDPLQSTFKEIYIKNKAEAEKITKKAKLMANLEVIGGTLFTVGATLHEAIDLKWITWQSLDDINRWLWILGGILIILPRGLKWISKENK